MDEKRARKDRHLRKTYGITIEDYDRMLEEQGGRCEICGRLPKKLSLAVDHNHKTGKVRGLLCMRCNRRLVANHSWKLLQSAANYLKKYGEAV